MLLSIPYEILQVYVLDRLDPRDLARLSETCFSLKENVNIYTTHQVNRLMEITYGKMCFSYATSLETYAKVIPSAYDRLIYSLSSRKHRKISVDEFKKRHALASRLFEKIIYFKIKTSVLHSIIKCIKFTLIYMEHPDLYPLEIQISKMLILLTSPIIDFFLDKEKKHERFEKEIIKLCVCYIQQDFTIHNYTLLLKLLNECNVDQLRLFILQIKQNSFKIEENKRLSKLTSILKNKMNVNAN